MAFDPGILGKQKPINFGPVIAQFSRMVKAGEICISSFSATSTVHKDKLTGEKTEELKGELLFSFNSPESFDRLTAIGQKQVNKSQKG